MSNTNDTERREYFRIDDKVYFDLEIVSEEEFVSAPLILANIHDSTFSLSADFATLNNKINPVLNNISQAQPEIAQYLSFLNDKIDSLSQLLLVKENAFDEDRLIDANISASGIMFSTLQSLDHDQKIKLELVLLPEKVGILIFGRIVSIIKNNNNSTNDISIEFTHIRTEDQELLIKHNLNKQMADLRAKNDLT